MNQRLNVVRKNAPIEISGSNVRATLSGSDSQSLDLLGHITSCGSGATILRNSRGNGNVGPICAPSCTTSWGATSITESTELPAYTYVPTWISTGTP